MEGSGSKKCQTTKNVPLKCVLFEYPQNNNELFGITATKTVKYKSKISLIECIFSLNQACETAIKCNLGDLFRFCCT